MRQCSQNSIAGDEMGIRFYCPNEHRLNVKTFLAGKRGICPHCGVSVRIPLESQIPSRSKSRKKEEVSSAQDADTPVDVMKRESEAVAMAEQADEAVAEPANEIAPGKPVEVPPLPESYQDTDIPLIDPIQANPSAMWYVRPSSGNRFGPANGQDMRRWIDEGRVSGDALVWCEGWPDWRKAGSEFPELHEPQLRQPDLPISVAPPIESANSAKQQSNTKQQSEPKSSEELPQANRYYHRKKNSRGMAITAIVILGLLSVVLVAVFVRVVFS